jgi:coenzyme Q-binding protein COQ10
MTIHTDSRIAVAPLETVFDLVADVERYPEFLPLWRDAQVLGRNGSVYDTEQTVGLGPITKKFRTRTVLNRPTHIEVSSTDQIFRTFFIRWDFATVGRGCRISIALAWDVKSRQLQGAIDQLLPGVARTMVEAFENRARLLISPRSHRT